MKLIVARHGETEWNSENRVLGRTDISLNAEGRKQAYLLAEKMKKYEIQSIFVSPLTRAFETGKIVADYINADLLVEESLIEQNFGIYEGADRNDIQYQFAKREIVKRYPGGESYFDVVSRIYPFLKKIKNQGQSEIMIITHGGICRIINAYFEQMGDEEFVSFVMPNCGYKEYEL